MSELKKFDEPIELQRLRKLQILIETDMWFNKDVGFSMSTWKLEKECGTTACLCGMYAMAYPDDGLKIVDEIYTHADLTETDVFNMAYGLKRGFRAAASFYGLSICESMSLFSEDSYQSNDSKLIKAEALKRVKCVIGEMVKCPN